MKRLLALAVGVLLVVPAMSSALTEAELQQQILDLLTRISALQSQLDSNATQTTTGGSANGTTGNVAVTSGSVVLSGGLTLHTYLERGMSSPDVDQLQRFLARDPNIYPEGQITGFFGPLTERAVERFQVACGIVSAGDYQSTGYGRVGPRTREALRIGCSGGTAIPSEVGAILRVTPVQGTAPHTVRAEATVNTTGSCEAATYYIDFGDGSRPQPIVVPLNRCSELVQLVDHVYTQPGTYIATLKIGSHSTTVRITVGGVAGTVGTGTGANVVDYTSCIARPDSTISYTNPVQCRSIDGRVFTQGVTYTSPVLPTVNKLTVNPTSGTAPLAVVARFQIRPGDPYKVDWGDGSAPTTVGNFTSRQSLPISSTSFTQGFQEVLLQHTYTTSGTKTVVLQVGQYEESSGQYVWYNRFYTQIVNVTGGVGGSTSVGDALVPNITNGEAPLTVTFNVTINGVQNCDGGTYTLDFGDGEMAELQYPADACTSQSYTVIHRYTTSGTFNAKLHNFAKNLIGTNTAVKTATITVGTTSGTGSPVPFAITPGVDSNPFKVRVDFTLLHTCVGYTLDWGDSTAVESRGTGSANCSSAQDVKSFTHTYTAAGSYTIVLKSGSPEVEQTATVSISS